jgi:magnesium transporter
MIRFYKQINTQTVEIPAREVGCWINIYPPFNEEQIDVLSTELNISQDFFTDSLDTDEKSRFDIDDSSKLIVIKTPILNQSITDDSATFITIPIGIILHNDHIITISPFQNPVIDSFITNSIKKIDLGNQVDFVLKLFLRCIFYFLHYLKEINTRRNSIEREVLTSNLNDELKQLLDIQKSLVYFVTSLRSNELLLHKIQRTHFLNTNQNEELKDILDDVIIDTSQALEMANVYSTIMNSSAETYSSIISNNQNIVLKRLTSITIILMIPTLVASLWGMNVGVPLHDEPKAFFIILFSSFAVSIAIGYWFLRKRLF